jgi:hypothetical protein
MLLEVVQIREKPPSPFKLNLEWLNNEYVINKLKDAWNPFDISLDGYAPIQFL